MRRDKSTRYLAWLSKDVKVCSYLKYGLGSEGGELPVLLRRMEHKQCHLIITRAKPSEAWCRLLGEVFGNTVLQELCEAGPGTALGIAPLAASVATGELKGRRVDLGGDGSISRSSLDEAFAFPI